VTATLIVQPEAEAELNEAFRWYEARRRGLGHEFLAEASRAFSRIAEQPLRNALVHREARRALLRRFPYVVLYVARGERVFVLAVLHQRRNPSLAMARARDFKES
jgi:plasmid stabilization system protein ParE